jgi:hypothetical protein
MSKFSELIQELGRLLNITLQAEQEIFCKIRMNTIQVQLEYDQSKDEILLGSLLGPISAGKFREEVLIAALKVNNEEFAFGTLAYTNDDNLCLQLYLPGVISADVLLEKLRIFIDKSKLWKEALEQGNLSLVSKPAGSNLISPINLR